jgi:Dolichyl-phosphate-mannose-protein mannosyltransferase
MAEQHSAGQPRSQSGYLLIALLGIAFGLHIWGIQQDLPFTPEVDEPVFVSAAVGIAASGDLNPHWFGHPGSTVIYPLAAVYRVWEAVTYHKNLAQPDPGLRTRYKADPSEYYLLGRLLAIGYSIASLVFVYLAGAQAFGERAGLVGAWLALLSPLALSYAQTVRTDSAAVFFGMLALWLCLRLYDRPTLRNQVLAGASIGLAIASRYFMVALVPILFAIDGLVVWHQLGKSPAERQDGLKRLGPAMMVGLLSVVAAFALTTPYFFLDFKEAVKSLAAEADPNHLGADGFSPLGNLWWYLSQALPNGFYWPQTLLAAAGGGLVIWQRRLKPALLVGFILIFLVGICISALHEARWIIQLMPVMSLLAAYALEVLLSWLSRHVSLPPFRQVQIALLVVALLSIWPIYRLLLLDIRQASPSTKIFARDWILENIPAGSHIAEEAYTAPLDGTNFVISSTFSLATNHTLADFSGQGYQYLVASDQVYARYLAEPDRYTAETAFYHQLFQEKLLQSFKPSATRGGPTVRIYELRARSTGGHTGTGPELIQADQTCGKVPGLRSIQGGGHDQLSITLKPCAWRDFWQGWPDNENGSN